MAHVARARPFAARAETVWSVIGGFQSLADWHPAVDSSTRSMADGAELRRLALKGGGEIVEALTGMDGMSYGYRIVSGPLPVADYTATLTVLPAVDGCIVAWSSNFTPTADGAEDVIAGIYEAGFGALASRF
jgi:hypothetical protein